MKYNYKHIHLVSILFMLISLPSCEKKDISDCFKNTGEIIKESRNVGYFNGIELSDNVNLILRYDTANLSVTVEAGKNLIGNISTTTEGNLLKINNNNECNWTRDFATPINVYVSLPKLDTLFYQGSGDINCENTFVNDSVLIEIREGAGSIKLNIDVSKSIIYAHTGTTDISVKGNTWVCMFSSTGLGPVDLLGLECQFMYMKTSSPNHCYLNVEQSLNGVIENLGNVYYKGNPWEINFEINGDGNLIKIS